MSGSRLAMVTEHIHMQSVGASEVQAVSPGTAADHARPRGPQLLAEEGTQRSSSSSCHHISFSFSRPWEDTRTAAGTGCQALLHIPTMLGLQVELKVYRSAASETPNPPAVICGGCSNAPPNTPFRRNKGVKAAVSRQLMAENTLLLVIWGI